MEKELLKKVFNLFCGTDELRPLLLRPFKQNGFYFSTDAHSLIMVPEKYDLDFKDQRAPDCLKIFPKDRIEPIEINIPNIEKILIEKTPLTEETKECLECNGYGSEECNLGHDHDCEVCNGKGDIPIGNGKMVADPYACKYRLHGQYLAYSQLIRLIESCKILGIETLNKVSGIGNKPLLLERSDITFLVMPTLTDDSDITVFL